MNTLFHPEFIRKMCEAKRLQMEALETLMPEKVRHHLSVIEKEMKELLVECLMNDSASAKTASQNEAHRNVHTITID